MFRAQLKVQILPSEARFRHWILRGHTAIVFHFHLETLAREHAAAEIENLGECLTIKPMMNIVRNVGLEEACFLGVVHPATAIDEALGDVANLGDMKMGGNRIAIREDKTRCGVGVRAENGLQFMEFRGALYIPLKVYYQRLIPNQTNPLNQRCPGLLVSELTTDCVTIGTRINR